MLCVGLILYLGYTEFVHYGLIEYIMYRMFPLWLISTYYVLRNSFLA